MAFIGLGEATTFLEVLIGRTEVETRVGKLKNEKDAGKDEMTGEMIKGKGDRVLDWIWKVCNMASEGLQ